MRAGRWLAHAGLVSALAGCQGGLPKRPVDDAAHEAWVEPALGRAPDLVLVVRMRALRDDATYAKSAAKLRELVAKSRVQPALVHALIDCDELDVEIAGQDFAAVMRDPTWLLTLRGVPADVVPDALTFEQHALLIADPPTGSAVKTYTAADKAAEKLFVFPDRTWVIGSKGATPRLVGTQAAPPTLDFAAGSVVALYVGGPLLHSFEKLGTERDRRALEGLLWASFAVDAPSGDDVVTHLRLVYRDAAAAEQAAAPTHDFVTELVDAAKKHDDGPYAGLLPAGLSYGRDGAVLRVDLRVPRWALEKAAK